MYHTDRNLARKHVHGGPVPRAKLKEVIAAACIGFQRDGTYHNSKIVLRFLQELRPDGSERWIGRPSTIGREDLRPLLEYMEGGQVPRAKLDEILADECERLLDDGVYVVAEMVLRILDGLRPQGAGRNARVR